MSDCASRGPKPASGRPAKGQGTLKGHDHPPRLQTGDGERRKRYPFVAIDRRSRSVHLAVKGGETEASAIAFLQEAAAAFPFRLTHALADSGSCSAAAFAGARAALGAQRRHARPRTPQTDGLVERFNRRVGGGALGLAIHSHRQLERLLRGLNTAHNARRQRALDGKTPGQAAAGRLKAEPELASAKPHGRAGPCDATQARLIAQAAKEVSQPDG